MIPKVVHYIWLGGKPKSKLGKMCIQNWKEKLDGFEIIEWNEKNIDVDELCKSNKFFAECRKRNLWAFMADYLRLKILYEQGGIYFDTDIQVIKSLEPLLDRQLLLGYEKDFEGKLQIGTGVIGCEKGCGIIKECLDFYNEKIWQYPFYTIPRVMDFVTKGRNIEILPYEYLTPFAYNEDINYEKLSADTYTIHWFEGTWAEKLEICTFMKTKHIKNPFKHKFAQMLEAGKYYKSRLRRKIKKQPL